MRSLIPSRSIFGGVVALAIAAMPNYCLAKIELPNVFGDHMVVQRQQENPIWGKADANAEITIVVGDRKSTCTADGEGNWKGKLPELATGGPYTIKITSGSDSIELKDVLSGEVWICSGQSNMQWAVYNSENYQLEKLSANYPKIRMINFSQIGSQTPIWSHDGEKNRWMVCNSENVGSFSAVGYFFGRQLFQTLDVPIGLVNNAWGGSAAEAWIDQKAFAEDGRFNALVERWGKEVEEYDALAARSEIKEEPKAGPKEGDAKPESKEGDAKPEAKEGEAKPDANVDKSKLPLNEDEKKRHAALKQRVFGNARPGNIYNGVLVSHLGYGVRGVIWYQGEANAGRAYQYRDLFPLMITHWRERWGKDFPFYWVQLADFMKETNEPVDSAWAELREAQTMTQDKLPHTGQAVIIDIGEGYDIHPRNKVDVGRRLARLALKNEYGIDVAANSPRYTEMKVDGSGIILTFKDVGSGWRPFDVKDPIGFTIAGEDKKFYNAKAELLKDNTIRVSAPEVTAPVAVRYAWADNPVVNLYSKDDLPLTPFRTDDWKGVTADSN